MVVYDRQTSLFTASTFVKWHQRPLNLTCFDSNANVSKRVGGQPRALTNMCT